MLFSLFFFSTLYDPLPPQPPALATRRCLHLSDLETLWVFANSTGHSQEWLCHGTLPRQEIFMRLNHVHLLITPYLAIARIMNGIKGAFARQANAFLGHKGQPFWQDESFDHWVRNSNEFRKIQTYIEYNPVFAGFVSEPTDWRWSSAGAPPAGSVTEGGTAIPGCGPTA
jgi:hypothetical protein